MKTLIKILKPILLLASLTGLIFYCIYRIWYLFLFGIPSIFFFYYVLHELGHVLGCIIVKTKIVSVEIFGFKFFEKFEITEFVTLFGKVEYKKTPKYKTILFFGLFVSLLIVIIFALLFVFKLIPLEIFITISLLFVFLLIPFKNSDIVRLFKKEN